LQRGVIGVAGVGVEAGKGGQGWVVGVGPLEAEEERKELPYAVCNKHRQNANKLLYLQRGIGTHSVGTYEEHRRDRTGAKGA